MVTEETLKNFLSNKDHIVKLCKQRYMTNLRLIIPGMSENKDRVHLLVDDEEGKVDMLDAIRVQNEIKELIGCPVFVMSRGNIHRLLKEDMLHYPIPIEDDKAIKLRFTIELIPFSQDPKLELPLLSKPEPKEQNSPFFNTKLNRAPFETETSASEKKLEVSNPTDDEAMKTNGAFHPTCRSP